MEINPSSVVDILTLRYDPSIKPNLPINGILNAVEVEVNKIV